MEDIIFEPIIPIPVMAVICVVLIVFKRRGVMPYIRQILIVLLLFVINLRPMYATENIKVKTQKMDLNVLLVVDDTISMIASDQEGYETRLDKAKADMNYIVENLPGAKFSVICFNNNTHVMTPFTDSADYLRNAIDSVYPLSPSYATGTNISICIETLEDVLHEASQTSGKSQFVMFFLSDGENTDNNQSGTFYDLDDFIAGGAVMGYGTERGGHMNYYDALHDVYRPVVDTRYYADSEAVSRIDETNLRSIAQQIHVPYINMGSNEELDDVLENLRTDFLSEPEEQYKTGYSDIYFILMIPLALLTAYEFISLRRRG